jgi:hypothetical protein
VRARQFMALELRDGTGSINDLRAGNSAVAVLGIASPRLRPNRGLWPCPNF